MTAAKLIAEVATAKNIVRFVGVIAGTAVGAVLVDSKKEPFVGGAGWHGIGAAIGAFF